MQSLTEFVALIKSEAGELARSREDSRPPLTTLLSEAIELTLQEIKRGATSGDFPSLVILNLLLSAAREGYEPGEIESFVGELSEEEHQEELQELAEEREHSQGSLAVS